MTETPQPKRVLDYSAGKPGARNIRDHGFIGAVRYIGLPGYTKNTDRAEFEDFKVHGLGMALVFEWHADDWRGGFARGAEYYVQARNHANSIGFPADRPIYMAVDQDVVTSGEFRAMENYLVGAIDRAGGNPRKVGVYGEYDVCVRAAQAFPGIYVWQCRAWSGTPVKMFAGRHLYQHVGTVYVNGIACDFNDVNATDWGQHNYTSPVQPVEEEWDEMISGYVKGKDDPAVYYLEADLTGVKRRHVKEEELACVLSFGAKLGVVAQSLLDRVPKVEGSR